MKKLFSRLDRLLRGIPTQRGLERRTSRMPLNDAYLCALAAAELTFRLIPTMGSVELPTGSPTQHEALHDAAWRHYLKPDVWDGDACQFSRACIEWTNEEALKSPDDIPLRDMRIYNVIDGFAPFVGEQYRKRLLATRALAWLVFTQPLNHTSLYSRTRPHRRNRPMLQMIITGGEVYHRDDFAQDCWTEYQRLKTYFDQNE